MNESMKKEMKNLFRKDEKRMNVQKQKKNEGITLVALVISIIIIIILATVTINMAFGDNGLITQAQLAKDMTANSVVSEEESMNELLQEYANVMAEDSNTSGTEDTAYVDTVLTAAPSVSEGMIPVKWNGNNWIKTTVEDTEWYDYANKEWANIVLSDSTFDENGILNEEEPYSMLVWIPRYAYQITSQYHEGGEQAGNINIVFIDTNNENKEKSKKYSEIYPETTKENGMNNYVVHPAFNYGDEKIKGFWVGKFETSNTNCTNSKSSGEVAYTGNEIISIRANVTSWRNINIGDAFSVCLNINSKGNNFGLTDDDDVVDPHMIKNSEWGAIVYLSKSKYGIYNEQVWNNSNDNFITGMSGTSVNASKELNTNKYNSISGQMASTTGNITGIYDMSGGAYEFSAAYVENGNENLYKYGQSLIDAPIRYKDVYEVSKEDEYQTNYELATPENGHFGDAIFETSPQGEPNVEYAWESDYADFPMGNYPFFRRGGGSWSKEPAGLFFFGRAEYSTKNGTFRVAITVI